MLQVLQLGHDRWNGCRMAARSSEHSSHRLRVVWWRRVTQRLAILLQAAKWLTALWRAEGGNTQHAQCCCYLTIEDSYMDQWVLLAHCVWRVQK